MSSPDKKTGICMIDRDRLQAIVREAGDMAMASWPGDGHALEIWEKEPGNPVCSADLAVDAFLKQNLRALLPAAGWLSEETAEALAIPLAQEVIDGMEKESNKPIYVAINRPYKDAHEFALGTIQTAGESAFRRGE